LQLYLAVAPTEIREASRFTRSFAHVAYRIGPESTLLRRDLLLETRGGLLSVSDRDAPAVDQPEKLAAAVERECGRRSYTGAVLDFESLPTPDRRTFAAILTARLLRSRRSVFLPESYGVIPGAVALINTAVSGGTYQERLQEALARCGRAALDVQRLSMDFPLPAQSGEGLPLTREQLQKLIDAQTPSVFFSKELCARYFTYSLGGTAHFVLYDDAETLLQKLRTGSSMGFCAAFFMYPEVTDLLEKLFFKPGRG
jgi:hypothetical protein